MKAEQFYNSIVDECQPCTELDIYLDANFGPFANDFKAELVPSTRADDERPLSELHRDVILFPWDQFELESSGVPFKASYQQGPKFPDADSIEEILLGIDELVPKSGDDSTFVISQLNILPSKFHADSTRSLPFQDDVAGWSFDVWDYDNNEYSQKQRALQDKVIAATGGLDHRLIPFAYEEPCFTCGDWEKYFDSRPKYNQLSSIKHCVDPNNLFKNAVSVPVTPLNDK